MQEKILKYMVWKIQKKSEWEMVRVLVFGMNDNPGGVESFLMNYIRRMQGNGIQFDFLCNTKIVAYETEILRMGCEIYRITARSVNAGKYKEELERFFEQYAEKYQVIWVNVCSLANIDYLKLAKKYGIARRIIHSHNSQNMDSKLRGMLHQLNKHLISRYATDFWACSEDAGKWFYNTAILSSERYRVIRNAIDVRKFEFSQSARMEYRKTFNLEEKTVFGNIGRLHFQKNQMFLLDVFYEYRKYNENAVLLLVGQGEDEEKLRRKVTELNMESAVRFMGVRHDVPLLLSAMDIFVFPSLFEGLSLVSLEVQASGILLFASEQVIPEEIRISEAMYTLGLNSGAKHWAQFIQEQWEQHKNISRKSYIDEFENRGYSIETEVQKVQELFAQQGD